MNNFTFFLAASLLSLTLSAAVIAQPYWTDFTYTDWSPGSQAAIPNLPGKKAFDSATVWDGARFTTFFQGTDTESFLIAYSSDGQTWSYGNGENPINITDLFSYSMGNHTLACDPDNFPSAAVAWIEQSQNIKFKMWYANRGASPGAHFQYAESTDGINWQAFSEGEYCPPSDKDVDPNHFMSKPSILYRPEGYSIFSLEYPMDNRYIMYLNSGEDGEPYYYELHISADGLSWVNYARDVYCEDRFPGGPVTNYVTFSGYTAAGKSFPDYLDTFEEVYYYGTRQGWMLWTHNGSTGPVTSWYSTNGLDWVFREEPINNIGELNSQSGYWNELRNCNLDSVRLGDSFFFLRSGLTETPSEKFQLGAAIRKGPISVEVETPQGTQKGDINMHYRLYSWNEQTLPIALHQYKIGAFWFGTQEKGGPGNPNKGKKFDLPTGIGGYEHTFIWDSAADIPLGEAGILFRIITGPGCLVGYNIEPCGDEYDVTGPFAVYQIPSPTPPGFKSPTPTPSPPDFKTPTPTPTIQPTATPSPSITPPPSPTPTPSTTPSPSVTPTPTLTPSVTPTPTPSPPFTPTPSPATTPLYLILDSGDYDGDGTSDVAIFRESSGLWAIRNLTRVYFGTVNDLPVSGDYNGSGTSDIAIFRPSSGLWAVNTITRVYFGSASDLPIPSDYDGNQDTGIAVFRPSSGLWALRNLTRVYFGASGDLPSPQDYDGSGSDDIAIFRGSTGLWAVRNLTRIYYGTAGDRPVSSDYDGDQTTAISIFRPSTSLWSIRDLTRVYYGSASDWPAPADYEGNAFDEIAIFRPSTGLWSVRNLTRLYYGSSGDMPVTR